MELNLAEIILPPVPPIEELYPQQSEPTVQLPEEQDAEENIAVPSIAQEILLQLQHPDTLEQNMTESPPPAPLPQNKNSQTFIPGKFDYIKQKTERIMLENAWQAINLTENWGFMKNGIYSYMWSDAPEIDIISDKMEKLGYNGHSGFSFGWTMRQMQFIAQYGEENYKAKYLSEI